MSMEQIYEYGSRAGVWRLLRLFEIYNVPVTIFGVAMAMERHPAVVEAFLQAGHEIASHGWRWINYQDVPARVEQGAHGPRHRDPQTAHGRAPAGLVHGAAPAPNTRRLVAAEGGFLYDADDYSDDLPF